MEEDDLEDLWRGFKTRPEEAYRGLARDGEEEEEDDDDDNFTTILPVLGKQYKSLGSSLCSFLQPLTVSPRTDAIKSLR
jgi:hypothetical protein